MGSLYTGRGLPSTMISQHLNAHFGVSRSIFLEQSPTRAKANVRCRPSCLCHVFQYLLQGLVRDAVTLDDTNVGWQLLVACSVLCGGEVLGKPLEDLNDDSLRIAGIGPDN